MNHPREMLVLFLITFASGCGAITHDVRFSPSPRFALPDRGSRVLVEVLEDNPEKEGIVLGPPNRPAVGGPEHRYVLVGEESFGARLGKDIVAALRARGYRAYRRGDPTSVATDDVLILIIKAPKHSIQMHTGRPDDLGHSYLSFQATFAFECAAHRGGISTPAWSETIDYSIQKVHAGSMTSGGVARLFESLYWSAVVEIVHRFSTALPPSP